MGHSGSRRDFEPQMANVVAAENFRKFRLEIRRDSHQISRAASICGQLTDRGRSVNRSARAARISARSRAISNAKILRSRKIFENFGPKSAPNRAQSHAAQSADARHRCQGSPRVATRLRVTERHGFRRDVARFRTQNSAAAKNFGNFGSKFADDHTESHAPRHANTRHSV